MTIAVLAGGNSPERDISLLSGYSVAKALRGASHRVAVIDPCAHYYCCLNSLFESDISTQQYEIKEIDTTSHFTSGALQLCMLCDKVFSALHGGYGENGKICALLDCYGIPHNGSDHQALCLAMNKILSKQIFEYNGILTPKYTTFEKGSSGSPIPPCYPCFIKPANAGSSLGITFAMRPFELKGAISKALEYGDQIILERAVEGTELSVSILENTPIAVTEINHQGAFFDYTSKYSDSKNQEITPARISPQLYKKAMKTALNAHKALSLSNFSRIDLLLEKETELIYVLEANAIPGLTEESIFPKAALYCGLSMTELCQRMLS